ncbi:MAG: hypothetical protein IKE24_07195 [Clostridia bacterium]|nr:hypothetical protein [Clostridia bacterium]
MSKKWIAALLAASMILSGGVLGEEIPDAGADVPVEITVQAAEAPEEAAESEGTEPQETPAEGTGDPDPAERPGESRTGDPEAETSESEATADFDPTAEAPTAAEATEPEMTADFDLMTEAPTVETSESETTADPTAEAPTVETSEPELTADFDLMTEAPTVEMSESETTVDFDPTAEALTEAKASEPEGTEAQETPAEETGETDPAETTAEPAEIVPELRDLAVSPLDTNSEYSRLTFTFTAEGREYTCLVTGLGHQGENTGEGWRMLAEDIAKSFLRGEVFTLSENGAAEDYGLTIDLIDAEKINHYTGGEDSQICWAASAADMMEYAGWNRAEDEDAAYAEFRDAFNNKGGTQEMGISWYMNGVNTHHAFYAADSGDAVVQGRPSLTGAAQQQTEDSGGYWKEYAAAAVTEESDEEVSERLNGALDQLADGYGVGAGAYFYQNGKLKAGHALTVFGGIREWLNETVSAIRALFISDSDNRGDGSQTDPAAYPDEYTLYQTELYDPGTGETVRLTDYNPVYTTTVGTVTVLAPAEKAGQETEGTADPVRSANLISSGVRAQDADGVRLSEAEAGSVITVETEFRNQSYKGIPGGSTVRYAVDVYLDGERTETLEAETVLTDTLRGNGTAAAGVKVTLARSGAYTFKTRIIGVTDADGRALEEAYVSDNAGKGEAALTVSAAAAPDPVPTSTPEGSPTPVPTVTPPPAGPEEITGTGAEDRLGSSRTAEEIYILTVDPAADTEYLLDFDAGASDPESFVRLRNRKTGDTVDPENYEIVLRSEGHFTIAFREDLIRTLKPGKNDFVLSWENGRVYLRIEIL